MRRQHIVTAPPYPLPEEGPKSYGMAITWRPSPGPRTLHFLGGRRGGRMLAAATLAVACWLAPSTKGPK